MDAGAGQGEAAEFMETKTKQFRGVCFMSHMFGSSWNLYVNGSFSYLFKKVIVLTHNHCLLSLEANINILFVSVCFT